LKIKGPSISSLQHNKALQSNHSLCAGVIDTKPSLKNVAIVKTMSQKWLELLNNSGMVNGIYVSLNLPHKQAANFG